MNNLDKSYLELLQDILDNGIKKQDRTGTGTLSVFGRQIRHKMSEGFPLLTTKKMYWKGIVTELLWFLRGDTNIKYLVDNDCHIWDGDAYKNFERQCIPGTGKKMSKEEFISFIKTDDEFANKWGDLGPVYGKQWRKWGGKKIASINLEKVKPYRWGIIMDMVKNGDDVSEYGVTTETKDNSIDQIANSIHLLKTDPDSRRNRVNSWNVGELDQMILPPCHTDFQFFTRELSLEERNDIYKKQWEPGVSELSHDRFDSLNVPTRAISLMFNMRSNDVPLGLPFNLASYGLLLEIIAKEVNMVPDELIASLGDAHIYINQIDGVKEQLTREPYPLPKLFIDQFDETNHYIGDMDDISEYNISQFKLENYKSHPAIKIPLSN